MNKFGFYNPDFKEKRLVFMSPVEVREAAEKIAKEKNAKKLLKAIHKLSPLPGGNKPADILKDNPYAEMIYGLADGIGKPPYKLTLKEKKNGVLTLMKGAREIKIEKLVYSAIYWKTTSAKLRKAFKGKGRVSAKLLGIIAGQNNEDFNALLLEINKAPAKLTAVKVEAAYKAMDKCRPLLDVEAAKARAAARGAVDRGAARPERFDDVSKKQHQKFIKLAKSEKPRRGLDTLKMTTLRKQKGRQPNPDKWLINTKAGLTLAKKEFRQLGIPVDSTFYKTMFDILNNAQDKNKNTHLNDLTNSKIQTWFKHPIDHLNDITGLKANKGFDPESYKEAVEHFIVVRNLAKMHQDYQVDTLTAQEGQGSDSIARGIGDFVKKNISKGTEAVRNGDWSTVGMYAVGLWAGWRTMKELGWFGKDGKGTKYLAYAAAGYFALKCAENAGYDPLAKLGLRDRTRSLKGTPLILMDQILRETARGTKVADELDPSIVLKASNVPLSTLHEEFKLTDKSGIKFIHPRMFPRIFPKLARLGKVKMSVDHSGHVSYSGMSGEKLSTDQKEYLRVGEQLYLLAWACRDVYSRTLYKNPDLRYKDIPYEKLIKDPTTRVSTVTDLMSAVHDYSPGAGEKALTSSRAIDAARTVIAPAFKEEKFGFSLESQPEKGGHIKGKLARYPIMVVKVKGAYRIYLKNDYKNAKVPGLRYVAEIPIKGSNATKTREARKAFAAVRDRIIKMMGSLRNNQGGKLNKTHVRYGSDGRWTCPVTIPGAKKFGLIDTKGKAVIAPDENGKNLYVIINGETAIILNEAVPKNAAGVRNAILANPKHSPLKVFAARGGITFIDKNPKDNTVTLKFGKNKLSIRFTYDPKNKGKPPERWSAKKEDVEAMLSNDAFRSSYVDAIGENPRFTMNKTIKNLMSVVDGAPQGFVKHFIKHLMGQTMTPQTARISMDAISGSVPNKMAHSIILQSKDAAMQSLRMRLKGAKTLEEVKERTQDTLHDINANFVYAYESLRGINYDKGAQSRAKFMMAVDKMRDASSKSAHYAYVRSVMEAKIYLQMGRTTSDFFSKPHLQTRKIMKVFSYYTAGLDNHMYHYTDPTTGKPATELLDLDKFRGPAKPKYPGSKLEQWEDPYLRAHGYKHYIKYVAEKVYEKTRALDVQKMAAIPIPNAGFWDILPFDVWAKGHEGKFTPLDPIDVMDPWKHDISKRVVNDEDKEPKPKFTEFELEAKTAFERQARLMILKLKGVINAQAVLKLLNNPYKGKTKKSEVGFFDAYWDDKRGVWQCELWDTFKVHNKMTRSEQINYINEQVERRLVRYIYERPGRFKMKGASWKASFRRRLPRFSNIWGIRHITS